ncbi:MAG: hypothetical protein QOD60_2062 [Solirubrobacterales bacterium]|jgi:hypothetical protein|nr:hypothetical protein [Solirubrobacterales bacterium]
MKLGMRRGLIAMLGAVAACLLAPGAAFGLGITGTVTPASLQAGAHSDITVHVDFTGGQVKDLTIGLPPGVVGDPQATPLCTVAQLNANACPANTQVGEVSANVTILSLLPLTVPGKLFNLEAQPGEPARFGIVLSPLPLPLGQIILQSAVQLRQTDFGLNTVINGIPNTTLASGDTTITSQDITLYGTAPGTGKPFMRNPSSCTPATTNFSAVPYSGADATAQDSFTPTGCGSEPFSPTFSARVGGPGQTAAQSHPPVSTAIDQDVGEAGLQNATVLLPPNFSAELNVLSQTCAQADFDAGNCPANSIVGSAIATSPLLTEPLQGPVALITNPGLPKVGLDLRGPLPLKLTGGFVITPSGTGVGFQNLPDIPIGHFALTFNGGPGGLVATTADLCYTASIFNTSFDSWSGANTGGNTTASVDGCGPPTPRKIKGSLRKAHSPHPKLSLKITGGAELRSVKVKLPKSLALGKGSDGIEAESLTIKHGKRNLAITTASPKLNLKIGSGELIRTGAIGKRVKLKVKVVDASGSSTTRKVKIKARG